MKIDIDSNAEIIISRLRSLGFEAFVVGGAVRDALLSNRVCDTDIASSALPSEVREAFPDYAVIGTGIKHGTVTVVIGKKPYEVTTFRSESGYSDSRHPDEVFFEKSIEKDLSRRDFTINAMAYSPSSGLIDPFDGVSDAEKRLIRAVGDPKKRFSEDALRILRAVRFASQLGFTIENETASAMRALAPTLALISRERVYAELTKTLLGKYASESLAENGYAVSCAVNCVGHPEKLSLLPFDAPMRFACYCGEDTAKVLSSLKADNLTRRLAGMYANSSVLPEKEADIKRFVIDNGRRNAGLIRLYRSSLFGEDESDAFGRVLSSDCCLSLRELAVNGNDIASLGIEKSKIGEILKKLLEMTAYGEAANEKEVLLKKAKVIDIRGQI